MSRFFSIYPLCLLLFIPIISHGHSTLKKIEKEKIVNHQYDLSVGDEVYLSNQFGNIDISLWNENKIQIDIEIRASAKTDEGAQKLLDMISIESEKKGSKVSCVTKVKKSSKNNKNKDNQSFSITYQVKIPDGYDLELKNQFGDIMLANYAGKLTATCHFGHIKGSHWTNVGEIDVQFGGLDLDETIAEKIDIQFSSIDIGLIKGDADLKFSFCNNSNLSLSQELQSLKLNASYTNLDIAIPRNFSAAYHIKTGFGSFRNSTDFDIKKEQSDELGLNFSGEHHGKSGDGRVPIDISSSFSKIRLTH